MAQEQNIEIKVSAGQAQRILKQLENQLEDTGKEADKTTGKFGAIGKNGAKSMTTLVAGVSRAIPVIGQLAGAIGSVGVGLTVMADQATKSIIEMRNLSNVAGVSFEKFQALQYATSTYGVTAEQLSDQLKDVNDKVGDFIATGGGEFADVFENILQPLGYTVDQLKEMSSEQVLGAVIDGTERLGISQKEQVFYMEAIANDASKLIPLYRDSAKELRNMTQAASEMGVIIPEDQVAAAEEFQKQMKAVSSQVKIAGQQMGLIFLPAIDMVAQAAQELFKWLDEAFGITNQGKVRQLTEEIADAEKQLVEVSDKIASNSDIVAGYGYGTLYVTKQRLEAELKTMRAEKKELEKETRASFERSAYTPTTFSPTGAVTPTGGGTGVSKDKQQKIRDEAQKTIEELNKAAMTESEARMYNFNIELQQLTEFHDKKLITEEEYYKAQGDLFTKYTQDMVVKREEYAQMLEDIETATVENQKDSTQLSLDVMSNSLGLIAQLQEEGSALWYAAVIGQKGLMVSQAIMSANLMASQATAAQMPLPGTDPTGALTAKALAAGETMRTLGYANAAIIAAQGVAEIAGARQTGGYTSSDSMYRINERTPEMYTNNRGEDFLTIPSGSGGKITRLDNKSSSGESSIALTVNNMGEPMSASMRDSGLDENGVRRMIIDLTPNIVADELGNRNSKTNQARTRWERPNESYS